MPFRLFECNMSKYVMTAGSLCELENINYDFIGFRLTKKRRKKTIGRSLNR